MGIARLNVLACHWILAAATLLPSTTGPLHAQQSDSGSAQILGRVIDSSTGRSLEGVNVQLLRLGREAISDAAGEFVFAKLAAGSHVLRAEIIGYAIREDSLDLPPDEVVEVVIEMSTEAIELPPIAVEVRSHELRRLGFYDRRDNEPGGYFVTSAEIERQAPQFTSDVLTKLPSVRVQYAGAGRRGIVFLRGVPCSPDFYLDGMRVPEDTDVDRVNPAEVAGIEVYMRAMIPIQYRSSRCGVILIWTKRGGG